MRRRPNLTTPPAETGAAVDSLQRGLEALRCFKPGEDVLAASELATRLELPRSTTLRLLATLEVHGFLRHLPADEFSLDVECLFIGQALLGSSLLVRRARPLLQNLANRFGVHVLLCVPERRAMLALLYASGRDAKPLQLGTGIMLPVVTTSLGCAWLWTQRPTVQGEWLARLREGSSGPGGNTQVANIYQAFHYIEKDGVCASRDGWRRGVTMVAAPLVLHDGSTAAIGCLRSCKEPGETHLSPECHSALREAAEEIRAAVQRGRA